MPTKQRHNFPIYGTFSTINTLTKFMAMKKLDTLYFPPRDKPPVKMANCFAKITIYRPAKSPAKTVKPEKLPSSIGSFSKQFYIFLRFSELVHKLW